MFRDSVSVIIPTLDERRPITCASVPDSVETIVVREGNRAEARNIGVERSTGEVLVFCDDDIVFDPSFFWRQVEVEPGELRGLEDFGLDYVLTRFLVIHRTDFERIGGFDERLDHMEDTEFALRAEKHGIEVTQLPRYPVHHREHENDVTTRKRAKAITYLLLRHRTKMIGPLRTVAGMV